MMMGAIWGWVPLVGGLALAVMLLIVTLRNRGTKREIERTEEATKRLYAEQNADDQAREKGEL